MRSSQPQSPPGLVWSLPASPCGPAPPPSRRGRRRPPVRRNRSSGGAPHRKAGLIIRKDLEPGSVYADAIVHGSGLTALQWREKADDVTRTIHFPLDGPTRMRIERRRNNVTLFAGKEGGPLTELGSTEMAPFSPMYVGLGVCAHDDKAEATAVFSDVTVEALAPVPAAAKK